MEVGPRRFAVRGARGDLPHLARALLQRAPWHPAFCVVARKLIKKGTFVFTYSGELEQEIRNRDSVYVYDVQADNMSGRTGRPARPDLPDMVIDAEKYGGVARFVNDSRYRMHEGLGGGRGGEPQLHVFVFIDKCIHLCFYVTRDVKAREELVSTYGDEFWSVCTGQMLMHAPEVLQPHQCTYHQQLAGTLLHVSPPASAPAAPYLLEASALSSSARSLCYPGEPSPPTQWPVEEEWEVEYILSKGRDVASETHYLVKWAGLRPLVQQLGQEERDGQSPQLIQQFEQQLKQENYTGGSAGRRQRRREEEEARGAQK